MKELVARTSGINPVEKARELFGTLLDQSTDAVFRNSRFEQVIGISGLPMDGPAVQMLMKDAIAAAFLLNLPENVSILIVWNEDRLKFYFYNGKVEESQSIPPEAVTSMKKILSGIAAWGGFLNKDGEHEINLQAPAPGPHFFINLLLGNRLGFPSALQTTPKSVVDRLGRGSFRSHAAVQVLATRWDLRQEENGFPANRQFYLTEAGKQIFYSAGLSDSNIENARCIHSQNHTRIVYKTRCGLEIERLIFILPQTEGLPLAVESQRIQIKNTGKTGRNIRLVYTGMFGTAVPHSLQEDVVYSNLIMQSRILTGPGGSILALGSDYYPEECREDQRFHTTMLHQNGELYFPMEFTMNYNDLAGNGTLEKPENISLLSNKLYRKGPGFFAVGLSFTLTAGETVSADNFTGMVSKKGGQETNPESFRTEIFNLIEAHRDVNQTEWDLQNVKDFYSSYQSYLTLQSGDQSFDTYFNKNLPFQVLYQTFVSRSFCQTQKGYREIGFREIQDIYASMYYFVSGKQDIIRQLLMEWCGNIFDFGYAYHNFFWTGKEPGKWSDDALWFIQALYRYISLTGDIGFLEQECPVAGTSPVRKKKIFDTVLAIITYSGQISTGSHGLPLLDFADWNDCLKLDHDFIDGPAKEKLHKNVEPLKSGFSESVMNAFLLKLAADQTTELAIKRKDTDTAERMKNLSASVYEAVQKYAWKGDFFARVLFNRYPDGKYTYLGAKGDGLSADPDFEGSYFINSFSWAILSGSATEDQIKIMTQTLEDKLKTPFGFRLMSPADLGKIANDTATGHYFPGDRENGAVFKHASMMAAAALLKAAKTVSDKQFAEKACGLAYWMIDRVLPYQTMENPFVFCGNPRFCTQYNNSETGEAVGPMLSGTSTWLLLTLFSAFGIEYTSEGIILDPVLKPDVRELNIQLNTGSAVYDIKVTKPAGFFRIKEENYSLTLDGKKMNSCFLPLLSDGKNHAVILEILK